MKHQLWPAAAISLCSLEGDLKTREQKTKENKTKQEQKDEDMVEALMRLIWVQNERN